MSNYKIGIIGTGYVGLVTGVCFANLGNQVICHDIDEDKIAKLQQGKVPFYELGLEEMLRNNKERLYFTTSEEEVIKNSDYLFICVGSPAKKNGEADTTALLQVIDQVNRYIERFKLLIIKSTVPVGTGREVKEILKEKIDQGLLEVISNPEFLREGNAIYDFMNPDRIVIGSDSLKQAVKVAKLYKSFSAPILLGSNEDAEMIKYAANNFLATKISFINEIANICEKVGADINKVANGIGLDHRIGGHFLKAGLGFGGPCLTKDLKGMIFFSERKSSYEPNLLKAVLKVNQLQPMRLLDKVKRVLGDLKGKRVGILGLSFKRGTDDMRNAPSIILISALLHEGAEVVAYDPKAIWVAQNIFKNQVNFVEEPYLVADRSSAIIIVTVWSEFKHLDLKKLKDKMIVPVLVDGRNIFDQKKIQQIKEIGFEYIGIGRKSLNLEE